MSTDADNTLDLDALERWWFTLPDTPGRKQTFALIQRLREAEAGQVQWKTLHDDLLEMYKTAGVRIAQLERVREAARELVSPCEHERGFCISHGTVRLPCPVADLAAALASAGEK